jgi:hypothetical protein
MIKLLENHIDKECLICDEKAVKCPMGCNQNHPKYSKTTLQDVKNNARCNVCGIIGHKDCIVRHYISDHIQDEKVKAKELGI